jgi:hypothetical protein
MAYKTVSICIIQRRMARRLRNTDLGKSGSGRELVETPFPNFSEGSKENQETLSGMPVPQSDSKDTPAEYKPTTLCLFQLRCHSEVEVKKEFITIKYI